MGNELSFWKGRNSQNEITVNLGEPAPEPEVASQYHRLNDEDDHKEELLPEESGNTPPQVTILSREAIFHGDSQEYPTSQRKTFTDSRDDLLIEHLESARQSRVQSISDFQEDSFHDDFWGYKKNSAGIVIKDLHFALDFLFRFFNGGFKILNPPSVLMFGIESYRWVAQDVEDDSTYTTCFRLLFCFNALFESFLPFRPKWNKWLFPLSNLLIQFIENTLLKTGTWIILACRPKNIGHHIYESTRECMSSARGKLPLYLIPVSLLFATAAALSDFLIRNPLRGDSRLRELPCFNPNNPISRVIISGISALFASLSAMSAIDVSILLSGHSGLPRVIYGLFIPAYTIGITYCDYKYVFRNRDERTRKWWRAAIILSNRSLIPWMGNTHAADHTAFNLGEAFSGKHNQGIGGSNRNLFVIPVALLASLVRGYDDYWYAIVQPEMRGEYNDVAPLRLTAGWEEQQSRSRLTSRAQSSFGGRFLPPPSQRGRPRSGNSTEMDEFHPAPTLPIL